MSERFVLVVCVMTALVSAFTIDLYAAVPQMVRGVYDVELSSVPFWTSMTGLGWALGQFFAGRLVDFGVRRGLLVSMTVCVACSVASFFMPVYEAGLFFRFLAGLAAGVGFAAVRIFLC